MKPWTRSRARPSTRLRQALDEAAEARAPGVLLRAVALALLALAVTLSLLWAIARAHRAVLGKLVAAAERTVAENGNRRSRHAARARACSTSSNASHRLVFVVPGRSS